MAGEQPQYCGLGSEVALGVLARNKVNRLPVSVSELCAKEGIHLFNYTEGVKVIRLLHLRKTCHRAGAFSLCFENEYYVLFDEKQPIEYQRYFTARELGHCLLQKLAHDGSGARDNVTVVSIEKQSNQFAADLLAPTCVLMELQISLANEVSEICGIPQSVGEMRIERLEQLRAYDGGMEEKTGKHCFLLNSTEWNVYKNFRPFLKENQVDGKRSLHHYACRVRGSGTVG